MLKVDEERIKWKAEAKMCAAREATAAELKAKAEEQGTRLSGEGRKARGNDRA